jgi:hypothetical protein
MLRKERLCSLYFVVKSRPVWPMQTFLQSGQVSLYTMESENLSGFRLLCIKWFGKV